MSVMFGACSHNRFRGPFAGSTKVSTVRYCVASPAGRNESVGIIGGRYRPPPFTLDAGFAARADLRQALRDALL